MCKDYRGIQERVMNNGMVMRETKIQLPDINQTTLSQWYIKQQKKKEKEILKQGLPQPIQATAASKKPLPEAKALPPSLPQVNFPVPFNFVLPSNTTGTAVLRGPSSKPRPPVPIFTAPVPFLQPPTVVQRCHPVPIQPQIKIQHQQPQQQKPQSQLQQTPKEKMKQGLPRNREQAAVISDRCMI